MTEIAILWPMFPENKHSSFPKETWQKEVSCSVGVSDVSWGGGVPLLTPGLWRVMLPSGGQCLQV